MKTITFRVEGKPQGKDRPRFTTRGGYARTYTTDKTRSYEDLIVLSYKQSTKDLYFDSEPIRAVITVSFTPNMSASKKNKELMLLDKIKPTKKPDCDNVAKVVLDALNKVAYKDDSQVVELVVYKIYTETDCVIVTLTEV